MQKDNLPKRYKIPFPSSQGTSMNRNKENSGRWRTARSEENPELVRTILENNLNLTRICIEKYGRYGEWKFSEVVLHRFLSKQRFLQICSKFTGEHQYGSVISIKLVCTFTELTPFHGCFHVFYHIFVEHILEKTCGRLLLN